MQVVVEAPRAPRAPEDLARSKRVSAQGASPPRASRNVLSSMRSQKQCPRQQRATQRGAVFVCGEARAGTRRVSSVTTQLW